MLGIKRKVSCPAQQVMGCVPRPGCTWNLGTGNLKMQGARPGGSGRRDHRDGQGKTLPALPNQRDARTRHGRSTSAEVFPPNSSFWQRLANGRKKSLGNRIASLQPHLYTQRETLDLQLRFCRLDGVQSLPFRHYVDLQRAPNMRQLSAVGRTPARSTRPPALVVDGPQF